MEEEEQIEKYPSVFIRGKALKVNVIFFQDCAMESLSIVNFEIHVAYR